MNILMHITISEEKEAESQTIIFNIVFKTNTTVTAN